MSLNLVLRLAWCITLTPSHVLAAAVADRRACAGHATAEIVGMMAVLLSVGVFAAVM
jgi:hypothetical protein